MLGVGLMLGAGLVAKTSASPASMSSLPATLDSSFDQLLRSICSKSRDSPSSRGWSSRAMGIYLLPLDPPVPPRALPLDPPVPPPRAENRPGIPEMGAHGVCPHL